MRAADGKIPFGEWLPDLPALDNTGLTEAKNITPVDGTYKPYLPLSSSGDALAARPQGAASVFDASGSGFLYVGTATKLYVASGSNWTDKSDAAYGTASNGYWRFTQFENVILATNFADAPRRLVIGAGGNFATMAAGASKGRQIGVINNFVVMGDTDDGVNGHVPHRQHWSAIGDETNFPAVNTAAAYAVQSGEQFMNSNFGPIQNIISGDQFGIIIQRGGISRQTYVGGSVVFQFDLIERARGALFPNATVTVGRRSYFVSGDGFYATDGIDVAPIGQRKIDNWFGDNIDTAYPERMYGAVDYANKLIYWAFAGTANTSGRPNKLLFYNYEEGRWGHAEDENEVLITGLTLAVTLDQLDSYFASIDLVTPSLDSSYWAGGNNTMFAFDSTYKLGTFSGSAGTCRLETGEAEFNPGGFTSVQGVKPLLEATSAPTATNIYLGYRNKLTDAVTYTATSAPHTRSGFAGFRNTSRYHRARVDVQGNFTSLAGIEFQQNNAGFS